MYALLSSSTANIFGECSGFLADRDTEMPYALTDSGGTAPFISHRH